MLEPAEMTLLSPEAVHEIMTQSPGANSDPPAPKKSKAGRKPVPDEPCEHGPSAKSCQKCIYRNRVERVRCCVIFPEFAIYGVLVATRGTIAL